MKNVILLSAAILCITICTFSISCKKSATGPDACVSILSDTVYVYQPVVFKSCTKGTNTYQWNFGDGSSAVGDSVTHAYSVAGVYHGSLVATSGQSNSKPFIVVAVSNPGGYFTFNGLNFLPNAYSNTSQATNIYQVNAEYVKDSIIIKDLTCAFSNSTPVTTGYYTIVAPYANQILAGDVGIYLSQDTGHTQYISNGNGVQKAYVTVLPNGRLNITASAVEMFNLANPYDSSALTFNITQTP